MAVNVSMTYKSNADATAYILSGNTLKNEPDIVELTWGDEGKPASDAQKRSRGSDSTSLSRLMSSAENGKNRLMKGINVHCPSLIAITIDFRQFRAEVILLIIFD